MESKKCGLVLEGGAMRGMFTAGVLDVFMENDISFDGIVGVSAGATFGCNYLSKQIGRTIRYNKEYCRDKRYCSFKSLITTGDLYGEDFCYNKIPNELDPFDADAAKQSTTPFYVVCTNINTGKPEYKLYDVDDPDALKFMRASASMPMVSRIVKIDNEEYLDGGVADSIPIKFFENQGYEKNVVILTQPDGYIKKKNKIIPLVSFLYRKYPNLIKAMANRHTMYNKTTEYIKEQEKNGNAYVIRPEFPLEAGHIEHDADVLEKTYQAGRAAGLKHLENIINFIKKSSE